MLNKKLFNILFHLKEIQPWLSSKSIEIENLLFNECGNKDEQDLILDLLNRFEYMKHEEFFNFLEKIVKIITSSEQNKIENTIIAATTINKNPDSAQFVLYSMKRYFQENQWNNPKLVNDFNRIVDEFPEYFNIILIDEFIGSGNTVINRVAELKRRLENKGNDNYFIKVYAVASSVLGLNAIEERGIELECNVIIPRGISDFYGTEKGAKLQLMRGLECILSREYKGREMPSLGYGETEALYAREQANSPNSVFPIFWWPFYYHDEERHTILVRLMGDA